MDKFSAIVVDDEPSVCDAVRAILEMEGIAVTTAVSSLAALELVGKNDYDLYIVDLKMPDMDGIQFHSKVREIGRTGTFIIMTANSDLWKTEEALVKGVYDYLLKPFVPDDLRISIRQRLKLLQKQKRSGKPAGSLDPS